MPKEIPEAIRLFLREYYLGVAKRVRPHKGITRIVNACKVIQKQFPRYFKGLLLEQIDDILHLPSEDECKEMVKGFTCPRCGSGDHLIVSVKGSDDDGIPMAGYDVYCTAPDNGVFSKCWYHLTRKEKYGMEKWI